MTAGAPLVVLEDVSRAYGRGDATVRALDGVSLTVAGGARLSVMGPSGSGKTTLLAILGLLELPTSGSVAFDGRPVVGLTEEQRTAVRRGGVGFVFQAFHLIPALTAVENVMLPLLPYRQRRILEPTALDWLRRLGLERRAEHRPAQLSGGEQQRVAIARALLTEPKLILADEPTGNLDTDVGGEVVDLLLQTQAERGFALVVATHDSAIAERVGPIIRLRDGHLA